MWNFFYLRKSDFLVINYRFSHDRYQIRVRNFKIRIRGQSYVFNTKFVILLLKEDIGEIFWSGT